MANLCAIARTRTGDTDIYKKELLRLSVSDDRDRSNSYALPQRALNIAVVWTRFVLCLLCECVSVAKQILCDPTTQANKEHPYPLSLTAFTVSMTFVVIPSPDVVRVSTSPVLGVINIDLVVSNKTASFTVGSSAADENA